MKKKLLLAGLLTILVLVTLQLSAQVGINTDGSQPDPSAGLDVKFSNKGFLLPRMTRAELYSIANPADGLLVFCTDCGTGGSGVLSMFLSGMSHIMEVPINMANDI